MQKTKAGTQVTIGEVLEIEAGGDSAAFTRPKREDAEEVLNYRRAMRACVAEMEYRPFSQQILRGAHGLLMQGVREEAVPAGGWRKIWEGSRPGDKVERYRLYQRNPRAP